MAEMTGEPPNYTCANCGRMIGALEQPYQWGDAIVCPRCCAVLQSHGQTQRAPKRRRKTYTDPLIPIQLILLIVFVGMIVIGVATENGDVARQSGWVLIAIFVLVIVSRVMRGNWENMQK